MSEHDAQTKRHILDSALRLFAAKGYDGTSVDSIARATGVNKATIYYYFPSKNAILNCLIEEFLQNFVRRTMEIIGREETLAIYHAAIAVRDGQPALRDKDSIKILDGFVEEWMECFFSLVEAHRDILRILLTESLKDGENQRLLFRLSDMIAGITPEYKDTYEKLNMPGLSGDLLVMKFFGGLLPVIYYSVAAGAWEAHYGMPRAALRKAVQDLLLMELNGYYYHTAGKEHGHD